MQVFISHSSLDKAVVEPIGAYLQQHGIQVWIDSWSMTPGDSLVGRIGDAIETSDRLVVCLTPNSVDSAWVRKEVATGVVMELAEEKGLGSKFVVPALLAPCKVPVMLRDKVFANFTDKAFDAACQELLAGVRDTPSAPAVDRLENTIVRRCSATPRGEGTHAVIVEFAVRVSPTGGLHVGMDLGVEYTDVQEWFGPPGIGEFPESTGGVFERSTTRREPPEFARKFSSPGLSSSKSYYVYFEAEEPFAISRVTFLDFHDRQP